jgi:hypothetical protein
MGVLLRIAVVVAAAIAAGGCPAGDENPPIDAPGDGGGGGNGLTLQWNSRPSTIPSGPSSNVTIDRVVFRQDDLRVVGDAGSLELDRDRLEWSRGIAPTELPVTGALPGLYSRLLFELEGSEDGNLAYAYEITGTVKINNMFQPFTIRDTAELSLSLELSVTLPAGGSATIPVRIEIDRIVDVVSFSQVPRQDGRYLVDESSPQISSVRAAVRAAFSINGPG